MIVNYTTIRSVDGLSQDDLRDPTISGTYTDTAIVVEGGTNNYVIISAGTTTFDFDTKWIVDTHPGKNFIAEGVSTILDIAYLGGPTSTLTSVAATVVQTLDPIVHGPAGQAYEIRRNAYGGDLIFDFTKNFLAASPPLPVVLGDTVVNLDTSDTTTVAGFFGGSVLTLDDAVVPFGANYEIRRGSGGSGDPGLLLLDVVPDGKGFRYIFTDEPTS